MSVSSSRRSFLRALGAFGVAMPFARLLERSALGQSMQQPLRFVGVTIGNGTPVEFWRPQPGFVINGLNQSLQPFDDPATYGTSFKNKLTIVDGICNYAASESNSNGHASGPCIWTGSVNGSNNLPKCESLETYLGVTKGLGTTAFPTLLYAAGGATAYGAGGVALDAIGNPGWLYSTLFSKFQPTSLTPQQQADAIARGKSSLDFVANSLTSLQKRLAAPEQVLLDQHLTAIRQIESRLMPPALACSAVPPAPNCPMDSSCSSLPADQVNQIVVDIFAQAIACDLSRFMQFRLLDCGAPIGSSAQDPGVDPPLPIAYPGAGNVCSDNSSNSQDCDHLNVAHAYRTSNPFTLGGGTAGNGQADITSQIRLARLNKYYMSFLASFAKQLNDVGALDSTLIVTMSDVGNPALHDCVTLPVIMLGGANGYFKMGQYVQLSGPTPQNALFVSIANAFGVDITSYGVSSNSSTMAGPLPGLT
jgi:hypothetical protein